MTTAVQPSLPATTWSLDPVHSSAGFSIKYMLSTFSTTFDRVDATLDTSGDVPMLTGTVDPSSIVVKDSSFAAHLASPDFFDVANHPEIRFASTGFRTEGEELVVEGDLTIKGHTHPVTARGTLTEPHGDLHGNERVGIRLEAVVDRDAFGVSWNAPLPKGGLALAREVRLVVELFLVAA